MKQKKDKEKLNQVFKIGANISRTLLGIVFIFSGFVKCVDPLGSAYKFSDYFIYAFKIPQLQVISLTLAFIMCAAELVLGIMLLLNIFPKLNAIGTIAFMGFFTPLTLYLAIANPVSDCGCFGDALILSNWNTFNKNVILLILSIIWLLYSKYSISIFTKKTEIILTSILTILVFGFEIHNYRHLPVIDFRPYKLGTNIKKNMTIPEGMPKDEYETIMIYEKNGTQQEFTIDNSPWEDTTWKFVSQESKLIKKGYTPPIHDFQLMHDTKGDVTDEILNDKKPVFLVIAHNLNKSNIKGFENIKSIYDFSIKNYYSFYCLTASSNNKRDSITNIMRYKPEFCSVDGITLKTIARANPSLVVIKNGIVVAKWAWRDIPDKEVLKKYF